MSSAEIVANVLTAICIVLAGRNNVHTWWTGIAGCAVFSWVFFEARLYGDAGLQVFFIATGIAGWVHWIKRKEGRELPVRWTPPVHLAAMGAAALAVALVQGVLLARYTDAAAPMADSLVFGLSVLAQFLLMGRRVENWIVWIAVNTIAVPLFAYRELYLTSTLYAFFWVNAIVSLRHWQGLARASVRAGASSRSTSASGS